MSSFPPELAQALSGLFAAAPGPTPADPQTQKGVPGALAPNAPAAAPKAEHLGGAYQGLPTALGHVDESKREGAAFGEAALKAQAAGVKGEVKAIDAQTAADKALVEAKAPIYQQILDSQAAFKTDFETSQRSIQKRTEESYNAYLAAVNQYKDTHVYSWYQKASTGAKALGMVSQALHGVLEGLGLGNGQSPLDKLVDDDYRESIANLQQKGATASQAQGLYAELKSRLKDEVAVQGALRDIAYQGFMKQLDAVANANGSEQIKAKAMEAKAKIMNDYGKGQAQTYLQLGTQAQHAELEKAGITTSYDGMWAAHSGKGGETKTFATGVPGSEYLPAEAGAKLQSQVGQFKDMLENADNIAKVLTGATTNTATGKPLGVAEKKALIDQYIQGIKFIAPSAFGDRASVELLKHVDEMVGAANSWLDQTGMTPGSSNTAILNRLNNFKVLIKAARRNNVESHSVVTPEGKRIKLKYQEDEENP